ncbi:glutathione S-transferase family protein [Solimonas terrae]|uniref:Glutathione S-transferase n=1 Tax=Solimonas terrae TaxID=1396819 RepID=A0A6M2BSX1_9GAMM|nr:glutathione S-transferase N-terminal domain-containing protein [Solimonas terrae]NGY05119.1 glutathione S-transferase [Solimonas terrae]
MTHYRLYYAPGACSLAAHIALEEIRRAGLADYATTRLLLPSGDQRRPEFLALNPRGHVPVLRYRLDGQEGVLTENLAILQFLASRHPQARLLPAEPARAAQAWEWLSWLATDVHAHAFMQVFYPARYAQDPGAQAAVESSGRALLKRDWSDLESRLPEQVLEADFSVGRFSVVDAYLIVFYRWAKRYGFAPEHQYPRWTALTQRTLARDSVRQAFADEGVNLDDPLPARPAPTPFREHAA